MSSVECARESRFTTGLFHKQVCRFLYLHLAVTVVIPAMVSLAL